MTPTAKGLWLMIAGSVASAMFLVSFKLASGLGDLSDATLVMLLSAAVLNSITSALQQTRQGERIHLPTDRLSLGLAVTLSGLTLAGNELSIGAVSRVSAPVTSVLQQTQLLFVAAGGLVVLNDRVTPRFWLGALLATAGLALLQLGPGPAGSLDPVGSLMAIGSAAAFAAMSLVTRLYIHRIKPVAVNALRLWIAVVLWFVVHRRLPHLPLRTDFVVYCSLTGVFGPFLSRTAIMYALTYVPPSQTTVVQLLTPAITLAPAFLIFGTVPTGRELIGGAILLAGVALPVLERLGMDAGPDAPASTSSSRA